MSKCAKCGVAGEPRRRYVPPGFIVSYDGVTFVGECIVRRCEECGYRYQESCCDEP